MVTSFHTDKSGFLWIGKMDGLYKYNGYEFESYSTTYGDMDGLSNPWVTDITEKGDSLLIGTKNGLNIFHNKKKKFSYIFPSKVNNKYSNHITSIVYFNNQLYIGTNKGLLMLQKIDSKNPQPINITLGEKGSEEEVMSIIKTKKDLLIQTSKNLYILNEKSNTSKVLELKSQSSNKVSNLRHLHKLNENEFLLATDQNNFYFKINNLLSISQEKQVDLIDITKKFPQFPKGIKINLFFTDKNKNLWIGSNGNGLYSYNKKNQEYTNYKRTTNFKLNSLKNDFIRSVYEDASGTIFIGTDAGVNLLIPQNKTFKTINHIKSLNQESEVLNVHSILEDDLENIWIGTRGKGLFLINESKKISINVKQTKGGSLDHIRSIQKIKDHIWIGTQNGIFIQNKSFNYENFCSDFSKKEPYLLSNHHIYCILPDKRNNTWISTSEGLYLYSNNKILNKITNSELPTPLDNRIIYTMYLDNDEKVWFGTLNGMVSSIDKNEYVDVPYFNKKLLRSSLPFQVVRLSKDYNAFFKNFEVYSLCQGIKANTLLVGTNLGLFEINKESNTINPINFYTQGNTYNKHISHYIYGLINDKETHTIWGSTNNGLFSYYFPKKELRWYNLKDGLQSLEFNGSTTFNNLKGKLYFGGSNGLNIYNSSQVPEKNKFQPKIAFTGLFINGKSIHQDDDSKILNKSINHSKSITLNNNENTIGLEFASLHLGLPNYNEYSCKLTGVNDDWIMLGNKRSINYANLPSGHYKFQLRATNNDGVWNENTAELNIDILPPWYNYWYMKIIWGIVVSFLILIIVHFILRNKDKNNLLKIKEIEHQKTMEINESKLIFFTNISHELRTPLSLIIDPLQHLIHNGKLNSDQKKTLNIVSNNLTRLKRLIDQIMDFRKHELGKLELKNTHGNISTLVKNVCVSFQYNFEIKSIKLKTKLPESNLEMCYDQNKIESLIYNLLSNALKASSKNGKIKLSLGEFNQNTIANKEYIFISGDELFDNTQEYIFIKVKDKGKGISPDNIHKIFKRFYQGNEYESGTGIGLFMVKEIVQLHNGSLFLKSKQNKGTTFLIILPKNIDSFKNKKLLDSHYNSTISLDNRGENFVDSFNYTETKKKTSEKNYTIALIEDNDELSLYIKSILNNSYNVITSSNGLSGLELIKENLPDLVISDIVMPGLTGIEMCKHLKRNFETSHIPIILLTAKAYEAHIIEGTNSGADVYLTKPFNREILFANIRNLINNREKLRLVFQNSKILEPSKVTVTSVDEKLLFQLKQIVEKNIQDQNLTLEILANEIGVSRAQLFRKVKSLTGYTPNNFIKAIRLKHSIALLNQNKLQISEVAYLSGFKEASYFSRCFKETYGYSPKEHNNKSSIEINVEL
ncbi:response regulator [Joostella atrarenae]|uniref:histidine kinase n=1 Tax=Joostella atrarenae TaxID=679257 RepID=A0ABS9J515_9FLAO|nr:response regulator [Joostella atrarenae]MCF8715521.1 response regulator [Joostella atrarenae]